MLASVLPGLRDLRAPLAAGYLWLAAVAILLVDRLPRSAAEASGPLGDVYRIGAGFGVPYVVVALTFVAYLVGILSTGLLNPTLRHLYQAFWLLIGLLRLGRRVRSRLHWRTLNADNLLRVRSLVMNTCVATYIKNEAFKSEVKARAKARWTETGQFDPDKDMSAAVDDVPDRDAWRLVLAAVDGDTHIRRLIDELRLVPEKLVGERPAAFDRYDRLSAEGEFRLAVVPPLLAVLATLAAQDVLSWLGAILLVAPAIAIMVQGVRKEGAAYAQLIQSVEAGFPASDELDAISRGEVSWLDENSEPAVWVLGYVD